MRILLVEDERELSNALVAILTRSNYSVDAVYDGEDALYYLDTEIYDVVILDIMIPKIDGIQVLKTIRQAGNKTPVIMLTAKSQIDDKVVGLDAGADDYLTKPFATKELLARLRAISRRGEELTQSVLTFGNISLNRTTFELYSDYGNFRLANKEYQIMEMLLLNKDHLISTEKFMDKIWGYDSEAEINVVWVHISFLRKKLSQIKANIQIKANRNMGYSLEMIK